MPKAIDSDEARLVARSVVGDWKWAMYPDGTEAPKSAIALPEVCPYQFMPIDGKQGILFGFPIPATGLKVGKFALMPSPPNEPKS